MIAINNENYEKKRAQNDNGIINENKTKYEDNILEIEKNSFNIHNKSNSNINRKELYSIDVLKKLDMVHPINNYYNNMIEPPNAYKVFIRPDAKHDFGNFSHFNDYVEFDPNKYKRPEIYFGYVHDQYIMPQILLGKVENEKEKKDTLKDLDKNLKKDSKKVKVKSNINKKGKTNTIKSLDDIMNKYNLKYIEPPKEKKVEPPPEEIPPEEEEENKDNKDKNKGKKESANKSKNNKDDKSKSGKPTKK